MIEKSIVKLSNASYCMVINRVQNEIFLDRIEYKKKYEKMSRIVCGIRN